MSSKGLVLYVFRGVVFFVSFIPLMAYSQVDSVPLSNSGVLLEEIVVIEKLRPYQIRKMVFDAEKNMYDLFNELNDEKRFEITCSTSDRANSHISVRECSPRYQRDASQIDGANYLALLRPQFATKENPAEVSAGNARLAYASPMQHSIDKQHEELKSKMEEAVKSNPELLNALVKYVELKGRYERSLQKDDE